MKSSLILVASLASAAFVVGCAGNGTSPLSQSPTSRNVDYDGKRNPGSGVLAPLNAMRKTAEVANRPSGVAIWVNEVNKAQSLILGLDDQAKTGSLTAFDLEGKEAQRVAEVNSGKAIDVETDFNFGDRKVDIAVVAEQGANRLRIFTINAKTGTLTDVTGKTSLPAESKGPVAVGLYKRPSDGAVFAIVAPAKGDKTKFLLQYRLEANGERVDAKLVRQFGLTSGASPSKDVSVRSIAIDDELGYVYYSEPGKGIRKYWANPEKENAEKELAFFGQTGFTKERQGLALLSTGPGQGYLLCVEQVGSASEVHAFSRSGTANKPHDQKELGKVRTLADESVSIAVVNQNFSEDLPQGVAVMSSQQGRNFYIFDRRAIMDRLPDLPIPAPK
ncbi:MAG: phytase [Armatimonadetes bacterium]|nr:phytase [Armatimonadota bacterium]